MFHCQRVEVVEGVKSHWLVGGRSRAQNGGGRTRTSSICTRREYPDDRRAKRF